MHRLLDRPSDPAQLTRGEPIDPAALDLSAAPLRRDRPRGLRERARAGAGRARSRRGRRRTRIERRRRGSLLFAEAAAISDDDRVCARSSARCRTAAPRAGRVAATVAAAMRSIDACLARGASARIDARDWSPAAIDELERVVGQRLPAGEGIAHARRRPTDRPAISAITSLRRRRCSPHTRHRTAAVRDAGRRADAVRRDAAGRSDAGSRARSSRHAARPRACCAVWRRCTRDARLPRRPPSLRAATPTTPAMRGARSPTRARRCATQVADAADRSASRSASSAAMTTADCESIGSEIRLLTICNRSAI